MRQIVLLIFLFISIHSFSQKMTISGNVQDTVSKMPLKNAVAMAIRMKDSVLLAHSRTDSKGYFTLSNLQIDTVQIIISDSRFSEQSSMYLEVLPIINLILDALYFHQKVSN
jgi:hypothetical protein